MAMTTMRILCAAGAIVALGACTKAFEAPHDPGVCYSVGEPEQEGGEPRLHVVARDVPQIEFCAARLEEMRLRFLRMGGSKREVTGAYQGKFIFIDRRGVAFGDSLEGEMRFVAMARTGDGRLAAAGAIQRDVDALVKGQAPSETAASSSSAN